MASRRSYVFGLISTLAIAIAMALPASTALATNPPTVTINPAAGQGNPSNASVINFTGVFHEDVIGFGDDPSDVTIGGTADPTAATVTGSDATYNVAISGMANDGTVTVSIPEGAASDLAGNPSGASTNTENEVILDTSSPTVTINQATVQRDPSNASVINFTAVFNEDVIGFGHDPSDVTIGGTAGPTEATVTGSDATYNVAISGMANDGTVTVSIPGGAASDLSGNPSGASTSTDNLVTFDATPPTITLLSLSIRVPAEDPLGTSKSNPEIAALLNVNNVIAVDDEDGVVPLTITGALAVFPPGTTTVTFTATDSAGNGSTASATVTVLTARTLTVRAIVDLVLVKDAILVGAPRTDKPPELVEDLAKFIAAIIDSLDFEQWASIGLREADQFRLDPGAGDGVFDNPADVVQGIFKAIADGNIQDEVLIADLLTVVDNLVAADRLLAQVAIADAQSDPNADQQEIAEALAELDQGDRLIAEALTTLDFSERAALISDAIEKYFAGAWDAAIDAVNSQASSDAESAASQVASDAASADSQAASDAASADSQTASDAKAAASQEASDYESASSQEASDYESAASQAASDTESAASQAASDAASAASQAASDAASADSQAASDAVSADSQAASDAASADSQAASDAASADSQAASDAASADSQAASDAESGNLD